MRREVRTATCHRSTREGVHDAAPRRDTLMLARYSVYAVCCSECRQHVRREAQRVYAKKKRRETLPQRQWWRSATMMFVASAAFTRQIGLARAPRCRQSRRRRRSAIPRRSAAARAGSALPLHGIHAIHISLADNAIRYYPAFFRILLAFQQSTCCCRHIRQLLTPVQSV